MCHDSFSLIHFPKRNTKFIVNLYQMNKNANWLTDTQNLWPSVPYMYVPFYDFELIRFVLSRIIAYWIYYVRDVVMNFHSWVQVSSPAFDNFVIYFDQWMHLTLSEIDGCNCTHCTHSDNTLYMHVTCFTIDILVMNSGLATLKLISSQICSNSIDL